MSQPISPESPRGPAEHDIRDQIVVAAKDHFSRYGYNKTSVSDLARTIGISKAYIYKFFVSKQAIGEVICAECLGEIDQEISAAVSSTDHPPEKLRRLFQSLVTATLQLFSKERNLYEIAVSAASENWPPVNIYVNRIQKLLQEIVIEGRRCGDFERKTPLDEVMMSIYLVMHPYMNPVTLQQSLDHVDEAPALLSSLILRSLAP